MLKGFFAIKRIMNLKEKKINSKKKINQRIIVLKLCLTIIEILKIYLKKKKLFY